MAANVTSPSNTIPKPSMGTPKPLKLRPRVYGFDQDRARLQPFRKRAGAAGVPSRPSAAAPRPAAEHQPEAALGSVLTQQWGVQPHFSLVVSPPAPARPGGRCRPRSPPAGTRERVRVLGVVAPRREIPASGPQDRIDHIEREQDRDDPSSDLHEVHVLRPDDSQPARSRAIGSKARAPRVKASSSFLCTPEAAFGRSFRIEQRVNPGLRTGARIRSARLRSGRWRRD